MIIEYVIQDRPVIETFPRLDGSHATASELTAADVLALPAELRQSVEAELRWVVDGARRRA
jgi:hypothetical protein